MSHRAALGTDPRTPIDSLGEAGRAGSNHARVSSSIVAPQMWKKKFRTKSRSVPLPSDSAGEPPSLNLIHPTPSRDAFDRERVYGAGITGETRLVHPRVGVAESRFSFAN